MNPEESDDSQTNDSGDEEQNLVPETLDDEFFNQLKINTSSIVQNFQGNQQHALGEEFQKLFFVCQKLRRDLLGNKTVIAEMKEEIFESTEKLKQAVKVSQLDHETIEKLKISIENAWKQTDAAQEREQVAFEQLHAMQEKLDKLRDELQKLTEKKETDEDLGSGLSKHKEGILKERDRLNIEVEELNRKLNVQRVYNEDIERKRVECEQKSKELYKILDETSSDAFKERRQLDQLKIELAAMTNERNTIIDEYRGLKLQNEIHIKTSVHHNLQILAVKTSYERVNTQNNLVSNKLARALADLDQVTSTKDKAQNELNQKTNLLRVKEDENSKQKQDIAKLEKTRENLIKKIQLTEKAKYNAEQDLLKLKNQDIVREKEIETTKKIIEKLTIQIEATIRERDILKKELVRANKIMADHNDVVTINHQEIKTLNNEIKNYQLERQKQKAFVTKIEMERDRNAEETQILRDRVELLQDEVHLKEKYVTELKGNITDIQAKLVHMQSQFETVRVERNQFQKHLQLITEERNDIKNKFLISTKQVNQLKEDISHKEAEVGRTHKTIEKLEKDRQHLKIEISDTQTILQNTRSELREKKIENDRLRRLLSDGEKNLSKIKRNLDAVIHDKNLLYTQVVKKTEELSQVAQKVQEMQIDLDRGESQYEQRIDDIRLLKIEIANMKSQNEILSKGLENTADMRQEVLQMHRVLNQERVKAKALEEEMLTPMNVHRWRSLGGKDPEKMELIMKVQTLQKRILSQTVTATERENDLQEAHKLYLSLKQFMQKLPSYKIKERLNETQHVLAVKNKKLKALAAELNTKVIDEKCKDCVVEDLRTNLSSAKKELVKEKKKKQQLLEEREIIVQMQHFSAPPNFNKTLGAGFKMPLTS